MNRINLVGRLINDPDGKFIPSGQFVAKATISVPQGVKAKPGEYPPSDLFNVEVWGNSGEALVNMGRKGNHIWVAGSHQSRKDDQGRVWWTVKNAAWGFVGPKPKDGEGSSEPGFDEDVPF